jgi:hypothetical protein
MLQATMSVYNRPRPVGADLRDYGYLHVRCLAILLNQRAARDLIPGRTPGTLSNSIGLNGHDGL